MTRFDQIIIGMVLIQSLYAQININGTLQLEYGDSENNFNFSENRLDLNGNWNQWMGWIQFESSLPPQLGKRENGIRKFRLEYSSNNFTLKVGDLYEIWGRGLLLNMIDDQSIDLDTGIRGGMVQWSNNLFSVEFINGGQSIWRSTNQLPNFNDRVPNYKVDHNIIGGRVLIKWNKLQGSFQILQSKEEHPKPNLNQSQNVNHQLWGATINYFSNNSDVILDFVKKDKEWFGLYINTNIYKGAWAIGISYKNYSFASRSPTERWDFVNNIGDALTIQQMPTGFRNHSSNLLGKITHVIDFNDEVGTYFTLSGPTISGGLFTFDWARSSRHNKWYSNKDLLWRKKEIAKMPSNDPLMNSFQEIYSEINGYALNDKIFYSFGAALTEDIQEVFMNQETDLFQAFSYESLNAVTFPTHLTYRFNNQYSLEMIFEYQELKKGLSTFSNYPGAEVDIYSSLYSKNKQINRFLSLGVARSPRWSVTLGIDYANTEEKAVTDQPRKRNSIEKLLDNIWDTSLTWANLELIINLNEKNRLSITYGSQRGGIYCSNGVCRYIQPFENGFKLGFVSAI